MKYFYLALLFTALASCSTNKSDTIQNDIDKVKTDTVSTIENSNKKIPGPILKETSTPKKVKNNTGFFLGNDIKLLNNKHKIIKTLKDKEGSNLKILSITDSLYNDSDDYCNAYNYVTVAYKNDTVIVDGRNIYTLNKHLIDTNFIEEKIKLELYNTSFYGVGFDDEDGLTFCSNYYEPIWLRINDTFSGLVKVEKDSVFLKSSWNSKFDYLEIMNNDGAMDMIKNISIVENGYLIKIHREFQEGFTDFNLLLKNDSVNQITAHFLNYPPIEYPE